jgi:O-antigen/teichoic acid export membrane protein
MVQTRLDGEQISQKIAAEDDSLSSAGTPPPLNATVSVSKKVAHGTVWSVGGRLAAMMAAFVSTPFQTRILGPEQYGIWALANTLIAYLTYTSLGMGDASTRFAAKPYIREDAEGETAVVWTSLLITLFPAVVGMIVVILAAGPLVEGVFDVPRHLHSAAVLVVQLTALGVVAQIVANVFNTPQLVRLRYDMYASLSTALLIAQHVAIVIILLLGGGLPGVVWMVTSCSVLAALTHAFASRLLQPALFRPRIDVTLVGPLLRFGGAATLSGLLGWVLQSSERLCLAHFGSVQDLAYYSVAASLVSLVSLIPSSMGTTLLPALSTLHAAKEKILLERLCIQSLRANLFYTLPVAFMLCVVGQPFLSVWAGPEYAQHGTIPLYCLTPGIVFNSMIYVPLNLLNASGRAGTVLTCNLIEIIPHIAYTCFLTFQFGAAGAALAWGLRWLFHAILLFTAARKIADLPMRSMIGDWRIYGVALLILVGDLLISFCLGNNLLVRFAMATAGFTGYGAFVWTKILSPDERKTLLQALHLDLRKRG